MTEILIAVVAFDAHHGNRLAARHRLRLATGALAKTAQEVAEVEVVAPEALRDEVVGNLRKALAVKSGHPI